jgi:hypothetical protein
MDPQAAFWLWSEQQQRFRRALSRANQHHEALRLFCQQHAMLHTSALDPDAPWSFADGVWYGAADDQRRYIPRGCDHSLAWLIWHMARTEDVAINLVLAGRAQVLEQDNWLPRLCIAHRDIGTEMSAGDIRDLSEQIDLTALWAYRLAVGQRTRKYVLTIAPHELDQAVEPERIQQVKTAGALVEAAYGVGEYWRRHPKRNLLLIPATRHSFTHLTEARRVRQKLR